MGYMSFPRASKVPKSRVWNRNDGFRLLLYLLLYTLYHILCTIYSIRCTINHIRILMFLWSLRASLFTELRWPATTCSSSSTASRRSTAWSPRAKIPGSNMETVPRGSRYLIEEFGLKDHMLLRIKGLRLKDCIDYDLVSGTRGSRYLAMSLQTPM